MIQPFLRHLITSTRALPLGLIALTGTANAQSMTPTISDCDWQTSAQNIPEPWEAHSRSFSNGQTRLAMLDTIEPALGWAWLMVLSPPAQEWGGRQCRVIGINGNGFAGMDFSTLTSDYDPAVGLMFSLMVDWFNPDTGDTYPVALWFSVNQASGQIDAILQSD